MSSRDEPGRVERLVPALHTARTYERGWLSSDLIAGLVLAAFLAPAGMAYATASGLPPVAGLYASIVPLVVYALIGPSRVFILGPDSSLTPLVAASVIPLAGGDPDTAIAIGAMLAILAGAMCIVAGLARFGFVAELLSAPVRYGYLAGIALTIIVSQAAKMCGLSVSGETVIGQFRDFTDELRTDGINRTSLLVGLVSLTVVLVLRWRARRLPAALIAVVLGIAAAAAFDLASEGVSLVGDLPSSIPRPSVPDLGGASIGELLGASLGIALVAFADTSVLSRAMSFRTRQRVDMNHELVALGACNVASGLFQGFPVSGSSSRTPVAEDAGSRTQLTGAAAAVTLLVVIVAFPSVFRNLPEPTLAAIVIAAAIGLVDLPAIVRLWRMRRSECTLAIAAFLAVALLGPITGVVVAVGLSILNFLRLAWKPHTAELVRVDGLKGYHDRARHPEGRVIPGLLLYRFDAPLFFANAHAFADDLQERIDARDAEGDSIRCVIITGEPITDIDTTAAETLRETYRDLVAHGIELRFAELKGVVHERLDRYHAFPSESGTDLGPPDHTARTTGQAVKDYLADFGVEWTDWEDRDDR